MEAELKQEGDLENCFRKWCADGYGRKHRCEESGNIHFLDHQVRSGKKSSSEQTSKIKKIAISGWEETTDKELIPFIHDYYDNGITKTICTDINRDGMLQGPAIELYKEIQEQIPLLYLIASGGISSIQDIEKLAEAGIPAVIFGKAIYEGKIQLKDLIRFT